MDKYIKIRMQNPESFCKDSFRMVWINQEKGIKSIIGKKSDKMQIQAYLFDKDKDWNEKSVAVWSDSNKHSSRSELYMKNKTLVVASTKLCTSLPNLSVGTSDIKELQKKNWGKNDTEASLHDKYYFYTESVHEGANDNKDYFYKDELVENYNSMSYSILDWEHDRNQIIGFALDAQLISQPEKPMAIGFNGIINRMSPYLAIEERVDEDKILSRDEIIRQRFFEENLYMSMEVLFDSIKCTKCGYETNDVFDFEYHAYSSHPNDEDVYRGLVGIDFIGNGIVQYPADSQAELLSLRTSDDGTLSVAIASDEMKNQYGKFAEEIVLAQEYAFAVPNIDFTKGKIVTNAKKSEEEKTKKEKKDDNTNKKDKVRLGNSYKGGIRMFKLIEKIAEAKTLSDVFVIAQETLKDYMGKASLKAEEIDAFVEELSSIVKDTISDEKFEMASIYTLTKEDKLNAISEARKEEEAVAKEKETEIQKKLDAANANIKTLTAEKETAIAEKQELVEAEAKKLKEAKINTFIASIESDGVTLKDSMKKNLIVLASACKTDEELTALKDDFVVTVKQTTLIKGSNNNGSGTVGNTETNKDDYASAMQKIREKYNKKNG